jgi:hypothetical protein
MICPLDPQLASKDKHGHSDPYCEVAVGNNYNKTAGEWAPSAASADSAVDPYKCSQCR